MSPYRKYSKHDPRYYAKRFDVQFGHRGSVLLATGILCIFMGIGVGLDASNATDLYPMLTDFWPVRLARTVMWLVAGVIAIVYSAKPQQKDSIGWLAVYIPIAYRFVAYLHGYSIYLTEKVLLFLHHTLGPVDWLYHPDGIGGSSGGLIGAAVWAAILFMIIRCSGWPEPGTVKEGGSGEEDLQ